MSWSYGGKPALSNRDAVRALLQDVDSNNKLIDDEFIDWALSEKVDVYLAAAMAADAIAARFSKMAAELVGDLSIPLQSKATNFFTLASRLRSQAAAKGVPVETPVIAYAGTNYLDDPIFEKGCCYGGPGSYR